MATKKATPAVEGTMSRIVHQSTERPTSALFSAPGIGAVDALTIDPDELLGDSLGRILARVNFALGRLDAERKRAMLRQLIAALNAERDFITA